jgi:hypothetical protein
VLSNPDLLISLRQPQDPSGWIALLEPYLPSELRKDYTCGKPKIVKPIHDVPVILSKARESAWGGLDLLSYLGVCQRRWKAVIWLIKAISSSYPQYSKAKEDLEKLRTPQRNCHLMDLETLVGAAIWADDIIKPLSWPQIDMKNMIDKNVVSMDSREIDMDRDIIGQIWQSAAYMVLQAADYPLGDSRAKIIMSHVFQILAHLHHINAFPHSIYRYNPPADPFVTHKPPTLDIFSSQIMTILSDTAWRARDSESLSENNETSRDDGRQMRQAWMADSELHVPELSLGIWLDLILWSCIEGAWISEAALIVAAIDRRKYDPNLRWSVIRWDSLNYQVLPQVGWNTRLNLEYQKMSADRLARGVERAGLGGKGFSINMPPRSISHEVVLVLIDALISTSSNTQDCGGKLQRAQQSIATCKSLLETDGQGFNPKVIDSAIFRLLDLQGSAIPRTPEMLEEVLRLSSEEVRAFPRPNWVSTPADESIKPNSAISLGLMHQLLYCFARLDLVHGALRSFKSIQDMVDVYSKQRLNDFLVGGKWQPLHMRYPSSLEDVNESLETDTWTFKIQTAFKFSIPGYALVAFLELIIRAELWDLGKWLLYSEDVDGPTIPSKFYSNPNFQPVFLRFATATADAQLLTKITENLKAPLSQSILRALLHCQIAVGKWNSVQNLLAFFRDEPGMLWDASDAMSIATAILHMEKCMPRNNALSSEALSFAFGILQKLICGEFNTAYRRAQSPDLTQFRLMTQIGRILRRIPGKLSTLKSQYFGRTARTCAPVEVPVEAFNMLLKGVVHCHGSIAGKKLWDLWCQDVGTPPNTCPKILQPQRMGDTELERVVQPDLQTLRIILQPIIRSNITAEAISTHATDFRAKEEISDPPEKETPAVLPITDFDMLANAVVQTEFLSQLEREILTWGISMYRKFGVTEEHLQAEVSTHLLSVQVAAKSVQGPTGRME